MMLSSQTARRTIGVLTLGALLVSASGCETMKENKEATIGAGAGGAAGAGIGAAAGGKKGALIGGLAGMFVGGAVGHYIAQQDRDRTQAVQAVGYRPQQGPLVAIEKSDATPTTTASGQPIKVVTQYTALMPTTEKLSINETRELRYQGKVLTTDTKNVQRDQGTYTVSDEFRGSEPGMYEVITTIAVGERSESATANFTVK